MVSSGDCSLGGAGILVTRPRGQAESLCRLIETHQGSPLRFPAVEISPPRDREKTRAKLSSIEDYDLLIFVSVNAVVRGLGFMGSSPLPKNTELAAIGAATARALVDHGYTRVLLPEHGYHSEALLSTPRLHAVAGERILIFRGEGGRPLLGDTLRQRGASIDYAEVYRRHCPKLPRPVEALPWFSALDLVIATSTQIIDNLLILFGPELKRQLLAYPLVVVSKRIGEHAIAQGFHQVLVADGPDNRSILKALCRWADKR